MKRKNQHVKCICRKRERCLLGAPCEGSLRGQWAKDLWNEGSAEETEDKEDNIYKFGSRKRCNENAISLVMEENIYILQKEKSDKLSLISETALYILMISKKKIP